MSLRLAAASSQYLVNSSPPALVMPFSVGMWVNLAAVGSTVRTLWSYSDTGSTNNYFRIAMSSTEQIYATVAAGGAEDSGSASTATLAAGQWAHVYCRFLSTTSRVNQVYTQTAFNSNQDTTSVAVPSGLDTMAIGALVTSAGASSFWDGLIAEYWLVDSAYASVSGAKLKDCAPWGHATALDHIVEHRSFRKGWMDDINELYTRGQRQTWVPTNSPLVGHHPYICEQTFFRPDQARRLLII
jgi:hypothetical protein